MPFVANISHLNNSILKNKEIKVTTGVQEQFYLPRDRFNYFMSWIRILTLRLRKAFNYDHILFYTFTISYLLHIYIIHRTASIINILREYWCENDPKLDSFFHRYDAKREVRLSSFDQLPRRPAISCRSNIAYNVFFFPTASFFFMFDYPWVYVDLQVEQAYG